MPPSACGKWRRFAKWYLGNFWHSSDLRVVVVDSSSVYVSDIDSMPCGQKQQFLAKKWREDLTAPSLGGTVTAQDKRSKG